MEPIFYDAFAPKEPVGPINNPGRSFWGRVMAARYAAKLDAVVTEMEDESFLLTPRDGGPVMLWKRTAEGWVPVSPLSRAVPGPSWSLTDILAGKPLDETMEERT